MKRKQASLILIFTFITTIAIQAQKTHLDFGLLAIPSFSTINTEGHSVGFKYIYPFNFGVSVEYKLKKVLFSSGIIHFTQGAKFEVEITSPDHPEGGLGTFDVYWRAKGVMLPLNADYIFSVKKTGFFCGAGIWVGYIYSQQQENTSIPDDYQPDTTVISTQPLTRFTDVDIVDDFYWGVNVGIGLKHYFTKKFSLKVRPNFLFQLRKELPSDTNAWTNRLMTFSIDIGFYYSIGKGIKDN